MPAASAASGTPEMFADVVGNGPMARARTRGASWSGTRRPIVGVPPVSAAGHRTSGRWGTITVSPPGQQAAMSAAAADVIVPARAAWRASSSNSITARSGGRRFASNNRSMPPGVASDTAIP
jgi:hypothetical protein